MLTSRRALLSVVAALIVSGGASASAEETLAKFDTTEGTFVCKLYPSEAPVTVANFVGLAEGTKEWKDPKTGQMVKRPLYNGTIFHRVINGFMIQGGDPEGTGMGGPGYQFKDEFSRKLRHSKKGMLSMANAGPGTNGSQFFVTLGPTEHLNNKHTIFGEVVSGMDVVEKIGSTPVGAADRPIKNEVIKKITIEHK